MGPWKFFQKLLTALFRDQQYMNVHHLTWSGQTKAYEIGICCFSAKHAALRRKKERLVGSESG